MNQVFEEYRTRLSPQSNCFIPFWARTGARRINKSEAGPLLATRVRRGFVPAKLPVRVSQAPSAIARKATEGLRLPSAERLSVGLLRKPTTQLVACDLEQDIGELALGWPRRGLPKKGPSALAPLASPRYSNRVGFRILLENTGVKWDHGVLRRPFGPVLSFAEKEPAACSCPAKLGSSELAPKGPSAVHSPFWVGPFLGRPLLAQPKVEHGQPKTNSGEVGLWSPKGTKGGAYPVRNQLIPFCGANSNSIAPAAGFANKSEAGRRRDRVSGQALLQALLSAARQRKTRLCFTQNSCVEPIAVTKTATDGYCSAMNTLQWYVQLPIEDQFLCKGATNRPGGRRQQFGRARRANAFSEQQGLALRPLRCQSERSSGKAKSGLNKTWLNRRFSQPLTVWSFVRNTKYCRADRAVNKPTVWSGRIAGCHKQPTLSPQGPWKKIVKKTRYKTIRPLLNFSRENLTTLCKDLRLPVYPDKSNKAVQYSRNRLRVQILPAVKLFMNPKIEDALFKLAELLTQDLSVISHLVNTGRHLKL